MEQRHDRNSIRKNAKKWAHRKQWIVKHCFGWDCYDNLHQYSKNKIYCGNPLLKSRRDGNRATCLTIAERRKLDSYKDAILDF